MYGCIMFMFSTRCRAAGSSCGNPLIRGQSQTELCRPVLLIRDQTPTCGAKARICLHSGAQHCFFCSLSGSAQGADEWCTPFRRQALKVQLNSMLATQRGTGLAYPNNNNWPAAALCLPASFLFLLFVSCIIQTVEGAYAPFDA